MDSNKYKETLSLAQTMRETLEQMELSEFPRSSFFERFPRGCCGDASTLLSKFLSEKGIQSQYVWGMYGEQSHAWLEIEDHILDITADQFDDVKEKVTFTPNRGWHSKFIEQKRTEIDFEKFNSYNASRLGVIYNNILLRLQKHL